MHLAQLNSLCALLAPQAGGGGSFGGGGGGGFGGGGGGGDGEGIAYLIYWLVRFAIAYPTLGVPLLAIALVFFFYGTRRGWWRFQERVIRRTRRARRTRISTTSTNALRASDPDFDEARFLARVRVAFGKAQDGWCAQELESQRAFLSDGVYERFSLQIEEQKLDGWRQGMDDLHLGTASIVHVEAGEHFDTLTVRIPFTADVHRLALSNGMPISGSRLSRSLFTECWSFLRRRGAKSIDGEGLMEGKCPNCGATLEMNQSARCTHCECLTKSGRFDWVLAEITQASEWSPERECDIPGLARYAERDPGMSVQQLEDRASVAYWRKCAADRAGEVGPLKRLAEERFCEEYAQRLAPGANGKRTYAADCAVGSVRTLGLLAGEERDRAVIQIVWDGVRASEDGSGPRLLQSRRSMRRSLFVFTRAAGQQTSLDEAFTTAHCQTCGAHDAGGTDPVCAYCGAARTGDDSTWLLSQIVKLRSEAGLGLSAELRAVDDGSSARARPRPSAEQSVSGLLAWSVELVRADGHIDEKEELALRSLAEREGVSSEQLEALLAGEQQDAPEPRDEQESLAWLASLTELAMADGSISKAERRLLDHAGESLGLNGKERSRTTRDARMRLYLESKEARRS